MSHHHRRVGAQTFFLIFSLASCPSSFWIWARSARSFSLIVPPFDAATPSGAGKASCPLLLPCLSHGGGPAPPGEPVSLCAGVLAGVPVAAACANLAGSAISDGTECVHGPSHLESHESPPDLTPSACASSKSLTCGESIPSPPRRECLDPACRADVSLRPAARSASSSIETRGPIPIRSRSVWPIREEAEEPETTRASAIAERGLPWVWAWEEAPTPCSAPPAS
eukprot:scaffold202780_cov32-Tisochrysis_lutea.AAC.5